MFKVKMNKPKILSKEARKICLCCFIILFGVGLVLNYFYRPYIYANDINDFHFADSFTDLLAVPIATFFILAFEGKMRYTCTGFVMGVCLGLILYEFVGLTFDVFDILAIIISGIVTAIALKPLLHKFKKADMLY